MPACTSSAAIPGIRRTFTLIELLVVVGIIAVLASLLLPALNAARGKAKDLKCTSTIRQGSMAFIQYFGDNSDFMPPLQSWGYNYGNWYSRIRPYVSPIRDSSGNILHEQAVELMCPENMTGVYTYGRPHLPYATNWLLRFRTWGDGNSSWRVDDMATPANTGLLMDMVVYYDALRLIELWKAISGGYVPTYVKNVKHDGRGAGISYLDGHAEFVRVSANDLYLTYNQLPRRYPFASSEFWGYLGDNHWVHSWATAYTPYDP